MLPSCSNQQLKFLTRVPYTVFYPLPFNNIPMKRTFLLWCCLALTAMEAISQTISGPAAPCPMTSVEYSLTLPRSCTDISAAVEGVGNITTILHGPYNVDGTQVTWKIGVTWQNSYAIDNATGKQAPFKVIFNHRCGGSGQPIKSTQLNVYPKALPDVVWQAYQTSIPCNFRGDVSYSIKPLANANVTGYVWTSTAGWPAAGNTNSATFNVNNSSAGTVRVVATSGCAGVTRSASLDIARPAPAEAPSFAATVISDLCPSTSAVPVSVTIGGLAPKGYEWYSTPANVLLINGASYNSISNVLFTTTPSVTLAPGANSATARLYVRAVYNDCPPSPFAMQRINVGTPSSDRFMMQGSRFDYSSQGPSNSWLVCPGEALIVSPQNNFEFNILEHQWQLVYGSGSGSSLNAYNLVLNAPYGIREMVSYQYRYRTNCGWSAWNPLTITTMDCDGGEDPWRKANTDTTGPRKDSVLVKETPDATFDFKISPNPATTLLNIELKAAAARQALIYKIIDLSGKVVAEQKLAPQSRFQVNTGKLQPGNYIISIQQGTGSLSKMFIVTR